MIESGAEDRSKVGSEFAGRVGITLRLLGHCQANDWAGHDPYDALNSRLFTILPLLDRRVPRLVLTQLLKRLPWNLRPMLSIPKTHNPKALALILSSQVKLHKLGLLDRTDQIDSVADRLLQLRSPSIDYWCWGYSFPWQTRTVLVPRAAPNLVCTVFVSNALLDLYESRGDGVHLEYATSAADYLLNELHWSKGSAIQSFAYPLSTSRVPVHNANLLGAALLCRVARLAGKPKYMESGLWVARYSASKQQTDGSWLYGEAQTQRWVDNFHTGFNLSALASIGRDAATNEFDSCLRTGFDFYRTHFIRQDGAPRYFHDKTYPIDIHCVAQSILSLIEFRHLHPASMQQANAVLEWALARMWDRAGYFYYRSFPYLTNKISYLRWSQAWMLSALVAALEAEFVDSAAAGGQIESSNASLMRRIVATSDWEGTSTC